MSCFENERQWRENLKSGSTNQSSSALDPGRAFQSRRRQRSLSLNCLLFVSLALWGVGGRSAQARKKTVTVTGFRGPGGAKARYYVLRKLRERYDVVPIRKYVRTAKRLGVRITGRRNIRRICRKAGIDAVVFGRILRSRGRWWLRLYIKDGRTGRRVKRSIIRLRGPRLNSSSRYSIRASLRKGMRRVRGSRVWSPSLSPNRSPNRSPNPSR